MNKYIILIIIGVVIIVGGVIFKATSKNSDSGVLTGVTRNITVTSQKDKFNFWPEEIIVNKGDKVIMKVVNEDEYDHGIAMDAFGISQRMPAKQTITIEFIASKAGDFPFYCSVPCGEGIVDGKKRTHFDMVGKVKVVAATSTNP